MIGHLGVLEEPQVIATLSNEGWVVPVNSGIAPVFPAGATGPQITIICRAFDEDKTFF